MAELKPEDFKEMTELEKQEAFYEQMETFVDNFISEYDISEVSLVGVITRFMYLQQLSWSDDDEEYN